jgi:hypothetical protein
MMVLTQGNLFDLFVGELTCIIVFVFYILWGPCE